MKKIIVLGGNGFIGSSLCAGLIKEGYDVYSFDIHRPPTEIHGVKYIQGDFFDDQNVFSALTGMDYIIHAVCTVNPSNSNVRYMQGYQRDFIQSIKVCEFAAKNEIGMLFLSSGGTVYGVKDQMPIKEEESLFPINHYGNIKLCIESFIRVFNLQNKTNFKVVRISNPYGPGQDYLKGVGFIDATIKAAINKQELTVWGDGSVVRDYVYIEDVVKMIISVIDYSGDDSIFNISSGMGYSQNDIIEIVNNVVGNVNVLYQESRTVDVPVSILDNTKILSIYKSNLFSLKDGIKKYYRHLAKS